MIRLGLIGFPIDQSLSPILHSAAMRACGLKGEYLLLPVMKEDIQGIYALLAKVRSGDITGLNITIPHKQNTIQFLDELTPSARAIGAVNTVYLKNGKLTGHNTDARGFITDLTNLLELGDGQKGKKSALILGAGGSARVVVYALSQAGWAITVSARRIEQALAIGNSRLHVAEYNGIHLSPILSSIHLIVNTTPIGMFPNIHDSPWIDGLAFPKECVLYDLIYNPRETLLVKQARAVGMQASTGLGMLVEQAALAFQLWTGFNIARNVMFDAINKTGY